MRLSWNGCEISLTQEGKPSKLLQYVCSEFLTNVKKHVIIEKMKRTAKEQKGDVVC